MITAEELIRARDAAIALLEAIDTAQWDITYKWEQLKVNAQTDEQNLRSFVEVLCKEHLLKVCERWDRAAEAFTEDVRTAVERGKMYAPSRSQELYALLQDKDARKQEALYDPLLGKIPFLLPLTGDVNTFLAFPRDFTNDFINNIPNQNAQENGSYTVKGIEFSVGFLMHDYPPRDWMKNAIDEIRDETARAIDCINKDVLTTSTPNVDTSTATSTGQKVLDGIAKGNAVRAKMNEKRNAELVEKYEDVRRVNPNLSKTQVCKRVAAKHKDLRDEKKYRTVERAVKRAGKWGLTDPHRQIS